MKQLVRPGLLTKVKWLSLPATARVQAYATAVTNGAVPSTSIPPPWRSSSVLDEWVLREARPISLRQLTFFGRTLTEARLINSANYVRLELPTRIAHRLRNMQTLPYSALTNEHISHVYELYYGAFERFRKVPEVTSLDGNDAFCNILKSTLREHLSVIPRLAMGVLEIRDLIGPDQCDKFMLTLLRSRISRRTIAEQHLALTETFHAPWHFPNANKPMGMGLSAEDEFVGEIFLRCNAKEIIEKCGATASALAAKAYGPDVKIPKIVIQGHMDTNFPYVLSHIEYIVGELLRNSIQAVCEQRPTPASGEEPPPIEVLICEAQQHVIIRISDQGGGVDRDVLPYLWSFAKGPRRNRRLRNLATVPRLAATMQELQVPATPSILDSPGSGGGSTVGSLQGQKRNHHGETYGSSLSSLSSRPPDLRLGMGLPMSKIYAEYWAGSLELHSLEGYGCDAFLQISRLGNKNEVLTTRASMDKV